MQLDSAQLDQILDLTCSIAWGATDILRSHYRGKIVENQPEAKDGPVTAADLACNHYIVERLTESLAGQDFGYMSEETYKSETPLPQDWVWIIDPLDGTRDFIDQTGEYAIHMALAYQGRPVLAVVAIPESEKVYAAIKGKGTFVESRSGERTQITVSDRSQIESLYLVVSRTHRDDRFQNLIDQMPFCDRNYVGSVGCKIVTILEKQSDVYISLSGKSAAKDWDFAAPELILTEAGGEFSYFSGQPVFYNQGDVKKWGGIMASNGHCHQALCDKAVAILKVIDGE